MSEAGERVTSPVPPWFRQRVPYVALALLTIALGLAVHLRGRALDPAVRDILGDALWASMIHWWLGALAPRASTLARAGVAIGICFAVEIGQLYRAPWIDAIRRTTVGHLLLGSDFFPRDLAAYALGVLLAALAERALLRGGGHERRLA